MHKPNLRSSDSNPLKLFVSFLKPVIRSGPKWVFCLPLFVLVSVLASCQSLEDQPYPHANESIGSAHQIYDAALSQDLAVNTYRNIDRVFPSRKVPHSETPSELPSSDRLPPEVHFIFQDSTYSMDDYIEKNRVAAMLILKDGKKIHEFYRFGNTEQTRWMSMSIAKSIVSALIGAALQDGYIESIEDPVTRYVPSLEGTAYDGVSIRNVMMMTSGVAWNEEYTDPDSDRRHLLDAQISEESGAVMGVMTGLEREHDPGTVYRYNTGETQIASEVLYRATGRTLSEYLSERIWHPMGAEADAWWWLDSEDGVEIGGSGFAATLRDYGRFGQFVISNGVVNGEEILPENWVQKAGSPKKLPDGTEIDYGYLWWTAETEAGRRDGAFSADGIFGQTIYLNPAENVVIVVWSAWPHPTQSGKFDYDWSLYEAVVDSIRPLNR
ncbi:MAG: serine hydrolase [Balneolaceae bacterium]|nr:serine hydrolase [Balneolaceae bacterium]